MINKKIEDITEVDLRALIDNKVLEGKTLEYKRDLPSNADASKKEFLADITSFANASGGDLILGIDEDPRTREPRNLTGLEIESIDDEKARLDNIIRTGVEPRLLNVAIQHILLENARHAILIRVPRSWISPHRVTFGGHAKFYTRNSSGKYEMDVDELRIAFNLSETFIERIRNFRADRIAKIMADETTVPLDSPHRIVLHLICGNAFNPSVMYDVNSIYPNRHEKLPLIYRSVMNGRYNLDGLLTYSQLDDGRYSAYTQFYRNGITEAVDSRIMIPQEARPPAETGIAPRELPSRISSELLEEELIQAVNNYLSLMSELDIEPPIFIFLSLLNVRDFKIHNRHLSGAYSESSIDRDILMLPPEIIETYDMRTEDILKPLFDLVWNACGEPRSLNFDENNNWVGRR